VNCRVCGNSLLVERAIFRCSSCRAYAHAYCWEKHVLQSHSPSFVVGTFTRNGEFKPKKPETKPESQVAEKEPVTL
jgi:hypothetical protein